MAKNSNTNLSELLGETSAHETDYPPLDPNEMEVSSDDVELDFAPKPRNLFAHKAPENPGEFSSDVETLDSYEEEEQWIPEQKKSTRAQSKSIIAVDESESDADFLSDELNESENDRRKALKKKRKEVPVKIAKSKKVPQKRKYEISQEDKDAKAEAKEAAKKAQKALQATKRAEKREKKYGPVQKVDRNIDGQQRDGKPVADIRKARNKTNSTRAGRPNQDPENLRQAGRGR
jgi:hypothetical protein